MTQENLIVLNYADALKGICHRLKRAKTDGFFYPERQANFMMFGWAYAFHGLSIDNKNSELNFLRICREIVLLDGLASVLERRVACMTYVQIGILTISHTYVRRSTLLLNTFPGIPLSIVFQMNQYENLTIPLSR